MSYQEQKALKKARKEREFREAQIRLSLEQEIVKAYESGDFLTKQIAQRFGISARQVQRICKRWGVLRSQREGAATAGPLSPRHRIRGNSAEHAI